MTGASHSLLKGPMERGFQAKNARDREGRRDLSARPSGTVWPRIPDNSSLTGTPETDVTLFK